MATNGARFTRLEERLRGWATDGGGIGDDGFVPWRPPTAKAQAKWDRDTAELEALIERIERGEAGAELDDVEATLKRLEDEREVEEARMARTRRVLTGDGTAHGRAPMARLCSCGVCEDWRRANRRG